MRPRSYVPSTSEVITALLAHRALYELGEVIPPVRDVGAPRDHAGYEVLLFGVLARHFRSCARAEVELATPAVWRQVQAAAGHARAVLGLAVPLPGDKPPAWGHWRAARDTYLATEEGLAELARRHLRLALADANRIGLLLPDGPGSLSHPHRSRTVYGDGTIVRPIYKPPKAVRLTGDDESTIIRYPDPATGELLEAPPGRYDPDTAEHHGQDGPVHGINYVTLHARGTGAYERMILTIGVAEPGREADTAVALTRDVHRVAGAGVQALVYDGALRGVHLDELMTSCGIVGLANMATVTAADDQLESVRLPDGRAAKSYPLGLWRHDAGPDRDCTHLLAAVHGAPVEIAFDDTGDPVVLHRLERRQVKRARRGDGSYHLNIALEVPCPVEPFLVWLSPHGERGDPDARRAENLRVIPPGDPDQLRLRGIRSDAEGYHRQFKSTLLVGRAMSKGRLRGRLDVYCFALLNNAITVHRAATGIAAELTARRRAARGLRPA